MPGYVHVYTGNGKGKTTAALGLALRAAGAGWRVFFAQFGKPIASSELASLGLFREQITLRRYGPIFERGLWGEPTPIGVALDECRQAVSSGVYSLVVLDEANLGPPLALFPVERILELIHARHEAVELVITGRHAHPSVLDLADLVTEMRELKHYYRRGVMARVGIEQ